MQKTLIIVPLALLVASVALAQEGPSPKSLENAELQARQPVELTPPPLREETRFTARARLERATDGTVFVSKGIDRRRLDDYARFGYQVVRKPSLIGHKTIYDGRVYMWYDIAPGGPSTRSLLPLQGQAVILQMIRDARGATFVTGVR